MKRAIPFAVVTLVALSGCASNLPSVPKQVSVATPVACVNGELPKRPRLRTQTELFAMDRYTRTIAVWMDRAALDAYAAELEAVLAGCRALPNR